MGRRRLAVLVSVGVLLLAAAVAVWRFSRQASETAPPLKLTRLTWDSGLTTNGVISPDGNWIAYWTGRNSVGLLGAQAGHDLFVIASTGGEPHRILEGFASAGSPIWSPDSSRLLFFGNATGEARSFKAIPTGGWSRAKEAPR